MRKRRQGKVYGFVPMGDSNPDTEAAFFFFFGFWSEMWRLLQVFGFNIVLINMLGGILIFSVGAVFFSMLPSLFKRRHIRKPFQMS